MHHLTMNWSKMKTYIKNSASSSKWLRCRNYSQLKIGISERGAGVLISNSSGKIAALVSTGKEKGETLIQKTCAALHCINLDFKNKLFLACLKVVADYCQLEDLIKSLTLCSPSQLCKHMLSRWDQNEYLVQCARARLYEQACLHASLIWLQLLLWWAQFHGCNHCKERVSKTLLQTLSCCLHFSIILVRLFHLQA